jgi:hypothetical protein
MQIAATTGFRNAQGIGPGAPLTRIDQKPVLVTRFFKFRSKQGSIGVGHLREKLGLSMLHRQDFERRSPAPSPAMS